MHDQHACGPALRLYATDLRHGVLLGRASDCHVRFDAGKDLKVSGHHALIDERDGKIMVRSQGSSNGLFLNDVRVTSSGSAVLSGSLAFSGPRRRCDETAAVRAPAKTTQALQAAAMAAAAAPAAATGAPERPPLKPAPGSTTTPATPAAECTACAAQTSSAAFQRRCPARHAFRTDRSGVAEQEGLQH